MTFFRHSQGICALLMATGGLIYGAPAQPIGITVEPDITRQIEGETFLNRQKYFALSDAGKDFEKRVPDDIARYLVKDLGVRFGRQLGPVNAVVKWGPKGSVIEDAKRPGFVDVENLKIKLQAQPEAAPGAWFKGAIGSNLNVAAHGQRNPFPDFMGRYSTPESLKGDHGSWLPGNIPAAAEFSANIMRYNYADFSRPAFYEPINEPHWSFFNDKHLADWHLATMDAVHKTAPSVKVGGPCMSVAYYFNEGYRPFKGMKEFIDNTSGKLDFYSFHVYDFLKWQNGDFNGGRMTTGLPVEGVLDLMQNYMVNRYGKTTPLVISEHGGYVSGGGDNGDAAAEQIAAQHFPKENFKGTPFEWEMKKRSITDFNLVSSAIANTLAFMDNPHVEKAVPFILLESMGWDPKYYSVLYVPYEFKDKTRWVPTHNGDFYKFFQGVEGRRVPIASPDPDIQVRAFVSGTKLQIIANNLWTKPETLNLAAPRFHAQPRGITVRRFGRNADFTPYFKEEKTDSLQNIALTGREAVLITADYGQPIASRQTVNEVSYYGDKITTAINGEATFKVTLPKKNWQSATLRIGLNRPANAAPQIAVKVNGRAYEVPLEDCAARLTDDKNGYGSTKFIALKVADLQAQNTIAVSFPDGKTGTIGSVVIRAASAL